MAQCPREEGAGLASGREGHSQDLGVAPLAEAELLQPLLVVQDLQEGLLEHRDVRLQLGQAGRQVHSKMAPRTPDTCHPLAPGHGQGCVGVLRCLRADRETEPQAGPGTEPRSLPPHPSSLHSRPDRKSAHQQHSLDLKTRDDPRLVSGRCSRHCDHAQGVQGLLTSGRSAAGCAVCSCPQRSAWGPLTPPAC